MVIFDNISDSEMRDIIWNSALPPVSQLVTIVILFSTLFVVGVIGNCMVIFVVLRLGGRVAEWLRGRAWVLGRGVRFPI